MHVRLAIKEASKARHRHQLGAVLLKGGKPVAVAHNHSHVHAEHAVIGRAWKSGTDGATLIVIRLRRDGSIGMAKPCRMCISHMIKAGIKKVIYSDTDGKLQTMKIPDINPIPTTLKMRNLLWSKNIELSKQAY